MRLLQARHFANCQAPILPSIVRSLPAELPLRVECHGSPVFYA